MRTLLIFMAALVGCGETEESLPPPPVYTPSIEPKATECDMALSCLLDCSALEIQEAALECSELCALDFLSSELMGMWQEACLSEEGSCEEELYVSCSTIESQ